MADSNFHTIKNGIAIIPSSVSPSEKGGITVDSTSGDIKEHDGTAVRTLVNTDKAQTISNKTFDSSNTIVAATTTVTDTTFRIQDNADNTKKIAFEASSITTGTTRTFTAPDVSTTLAGTDAAQTLSNKTINNTNVITTQDSNFTLQDNGDNTKQAKFEASGITSATTRTFSFPDANTTLVGTDAPQTITNKTIDSTNTFIIAVRDTNFTIQDDADNTKQAKFQASSISTGTTRTYTLPDTNTTLAGTDATQTLSNKTIGDAISLTQIATPATPASGLNKFYPKSDGNLYTLTSTGVESQIGTSNSGVPPGTMLPYAGTSAPTGYLSCDGTAVSRITYSSLFSAISTIYGIGDGSSTFNLPDTRGVFLRGAGTQVISTISYTGAQGTTQGDQIQGHRHGVSDPGHTHAGLFTASGASLGAGPIGYVLTNVGGGINVSSNTTAVTVTDPTTDTINGPPRTGSETRPANISVLYIIKT